MAKNIEVSKIVASSTPEAWSQAYHAGTLSVVISVKPKQQQDPTSLHIVGKDLLNTFESEYFTLENKHLASIKKAVETTYKKSSDTHDISFIVAAVIQNTLYLILAGNGNIFLLRDGKFATLLEQNTETPAILASSGFLENQDIIMITSPAFLRLVEKEKLLTTLSDNSLTESAEMLSPLVHAANDGDAAAVFFQYEDATSAIPSPHELSLERSEKKDETSVESSPRYQPEEEKPILSEPLEVQNPPKAKRKLTHKQKIILTVIVILVLVLGTTSYLAIMNKQQAENTAAFNASFPQAKQKYEEATGLMDLNEPLAHQDFGQAQQLLSSVKNKFATDSTQGKQIADLLSKVQQGLQDSSNVNAVEAQKIDASADPFLSYISSHTSELYVAQDKSNIYTADSSGITQITKSSQKSKVLVPNKSTWTTVGGFSPYLTNFYLLDTKGSILKFVPSGSSFGKSNYFASGVSPDLSNAVSIAIDGSIWVLKSDGTILKFTKGKPDTFALSGLDTSLSSPSQIVTSVDDTNVYILDNGNSRIVVIDKTGKYVTQYATGIIKKATFLMIDEKNKTATFLANDSFYQITLK